LGRIHARLAGHLPNVQLVGIADICSKNAEDVAAGAGAAAFSDHRALAPHIDAAIVATPTVSHESVAVDLARCGIHLLVEKPLATRLVEADRIVAACRQSGVVLQVGHVERHNPAIRQILPSLGGARYIEAIRSSGFPFRSLDIGVVLDLMIHDLDLAIWLVNSEVKRIEALGLSIMGGHEDVAQARLTFANGCVANLSASRVSYTSLRRLQVWTRDCFAAIDLAGGKSVVVEPSHSLKEQKLDVASMPPQEQSRLRDRFFEEVLVRRDLEAGPANAIAMEQLDFVEAIRTEKQLGVSGEEARKAVAVAEWILQRIASHPWDGTPDGRLGPKAEPAPAILRPPHWPPEVRRQAG
jgi:predicted dehydrogenase